MKRQLLQQRTHSNLYSKSVYKTSQGIEKIYKFNTSEDPARIESVLTNFQQYFPYKFSYTLDMPKCVIKQTLVRSTQSFDTVTVNTYIDLAQQLIRDIQQNNNSYWSVVNMQMEENIFLVDNRLVLVDESKTAPYSDRELAKLTSAQGILQGIHGLAPEKFDFKRVCERVAQAVDGAYN
jgi:hypothetical protein